MRSGPVLAPDAKTIQSWEKELSPPRRLLAWEAETTPRLEASDLTDPEIYYRRLEAWLMNQK